MNHISYVVTELVKLKAIGNLDCMAQKECLQVSMYSVGIM